MSANTTFQLEIQRVEGTCLFKLSWGKGQNLSAKKVYPEKLMQLQQAWRRAYLNFYSVERRGKAELSGTLALTEVDWRIKVARAEADLLHEFNQWLIGAELYDIRETIVQSIKSLVPLNGSTDSLGWVDIFLSCASPELESLPWETWEIDAKVRMVRSPINIRHEPMHPRQGRPRILVILGDDTGLNFKTELEAVKKQLKPLAEVQSIGWKHSSTVGNELKTQIREALTEEQGWDGLLFFGHSDEAFLTGGEVAIAPNTWITIKEIRSQLLTAKERGLQFALFNSCSGLHIANELINLGLSQVMVMREPIHNTVAQKFLVQFLQVLATHRDVHDAMIEVTKDLKLNHATEYSSAYLIPSLFCRPDATLFHLPKRGLRQFLSQWVPSRREAIALAALLTLSVMTPLQELLLDPRLAMQALYRNLTQQIPPKTTPPVLLVQVDQESLDRVKVQAQSKSPLDRSYLASILKKLPTAPSTVIGIDYVFDKPTPKDQALVATVQQSVKQGNWIVFATDYRKPKPALVGGLSNQWSLQADAWLNYKHVQLPPQNPKCPDECPFAYTLGLVQTLNPSSFGLRPRLESDADLGSQLFNVLKSKQVKFWRSPQFPVGLRPIIDLSVPPNRVYERIPAWQILEATQRSDAPKRLTPPQVIILAPGGYEGSVDYIEAPEALRFWRSQAEKDDNAPKKVLTGGEAHAYMVHHLLTNHLVLPIPDLWMVGRVISF